MSSDLQGAILGMCNPLLDISSEVPMDLLKKYGVELNNAILAEEKHMPLYKELVEKYHQRYVAELLRLFDEHKGRCGRAHAQLELL